MSDPSGFRDRLSQAEPILLDGPMGTELQRRGVDTTLPLWSAWGLVRAPEQVLAVHRDYVQAGAEMLTTNSFRTHRRSLAKGGLGSRSGELTRLAVDLARRAAAAAPGRVVRVAGSMSPLEDCYSPELTPGEDELEAEHGEMAGTLAQAGVDLLLIETMPSCREAVAAMRAAVATGLPVLVGLACDTRGRLLSEESVATTAVALEPLGPDALLINCTPTHALAASLRPLAGATRLPTGAYGNVGHSETADGWTSTGAIGPAAYAAYAREWLEIGARIVGGCCGTTPEHTRALAEMLAGVSLASRRCAR